MVCGEMLYLPQIIHIDFWKKKPYSPCLHLGRAIQKILIGGIWAEEISISLLLLFRCLKAKSLVKDCEVLGW